MSDRRRTDTLMSGRALWQPAVERINICFTIVAKMSSIRRPTRENMSVMLVHVCACTRERAERVGGVAEATRAHIKCLSHTEPGAAINTWWLITNGSVAFVA